VELFRYYLGILVLAAVLPESHLDWLRLIIPTDFGWIARLFFTLVITILFIRVWSFRLQRHNRVDNPLVNQPDNPVDDRLVNQFPPHLLNLVLCQLTSLPFNPLLDHLVNQSEFLLGSHSHFLPSNQPNSSPSQQPSAQPTSQPTSLPTISPSCQPSCQPTKKPTVRPSYAPSNQPTCRPSCQPTKQPTGRPSGQPSRVPSGQPSRVPSGHPSSQPTRRPRAQPSSLPSRRPSSQPSSQPTLQPSTVPTSRPSSQLTPHPSSFQSFPSVISNLFMQLVSGSAITGYDGDNGPATSAHFSNNFIWVDSTGNNVYIPDSNARIRKVNTVSGIVSA
jgi:hypothetical protein